MCHGLFLSIFTKEVTSLAKIENEVGFFIDIVSFLMS